MSESPCKSESPDYPGLTCNLLDGHDGTHYALGYRWQTSRNIIVMHANNLSTPEAVKALENLGVGRVQEVLRDAMATGRFAARTATGYGYTVTADDDLQGWHIDYETEDAD